MYLWKTKDLALKIKEEELNEDVKKNYYLASIIITLIGMYISIGVGTTDSAATFAELILMLAITVLGINKTFDTNKGNQGKDYIVRLVMLSVPLLIKLIVVSFFIGFCIGVLASISGEAGTTVINQWSNTIIVAVIQVIYFWRLNVHFKFINVDS